MINWLENHLFNCIFKSSFGIECPGCGTQRALISLLKGDIISSLKYHAGVIPFLITVIALIIQLKLKHPSGGKIIMWLFIVTTATTITQYIIKQFILS